MTTPLCADVNLVCVLGCNSKLLGMSFIIESLGSYSDSKLNKIMGQLGVQTALKYCLDSLVGGGFLLEIPNPHDGQS